MDTHEFTELRKKEFDEFTEKYTQLKGDYSTSLTVAIANPSPESIQKVVDINTELTSLIRAIVQVLTKKGETANITQLTDDLIAYQTQYAEIQQTNDTLTTLKMIKHSSVEALAEANWMYSIYIGLLLILISIILYLLITSPGDVEYIGNSITSLIN